MQKSEKISYIILGADRMKQETFKKILKIWKQAEEKNVSSTPLPRTEQCLSFAQLATGKFSAAQFEHISKCDYCMRKTRLFSKHLGLQSEVLEKLDKEEKITDKKYFFKDILKKITATFDNILDIFGKILTPIPTPIKLAIPSVLIIVIFVYLFFPFSSKHSEFAELAVIEPIYYQAIEIRGGQTISEAEKIFNEGMIFYQQKEYQQAINKLSRASELQPEDVNYYFYLGICYLLTKEVDQAISHLKQVIDLRGTFLFEKCYWYLGNAYLLKDDSKQALEMFHKVVEMEGDYEWEARKMIRKANNIKNSI